MLKIYFYLAIVLFVFNIENSKGVFLKSYCNLNETQCSIRTNSLNPIFMECSKQFMNLQKLLISYTVLSALPKVFSCAPNLYDVNINNCQLSHFQSQLNYNGYGYTIKTLSLQYNRLSEIDRDTFSHYSELICLRLGFNQIVYLHEDSLNQLPHLKRLEINNNNIEKLSPNLFKNLRFLNYIDLSNNRIKTIPLNIFEENYSLHTILLNNNEINNIDGEYFFKSFKNLRFLDLSGNNVPEIHLSGEIIRIDTLRIVDAQLKKCRIDGSVVKLHASKNSLTELIIQDKSLVREIDIESNFIDSMASFRDMFDLEKLNVAKNPIRKLNVFDFDTLYNLKVLNMDSIGLQSLNYDTFTYLTKLIALDLANNQLNVLDEQVIRPLKNLERLYIGGNHLLHINYEAICNNNLHLKEFSVFSLDFNFTYLSKMNEFFNSHQIEFDVRSNTIEHLNNNKTLWNTTSSRIETTPRADKKIEYHHHHYANLSATNILIVIVLLMVVILLVMQFAKQLSTESVQNVVNRLRPQANRSRLDEEESEPL